MGNSEEQRNENASKSLATSNESTLKDEFRAVKKRIKSNLTEQKNRLNRIQILFLVMLGLYLTNSGLNSFFNTSQPTYPFTATYPNAMIVWNSILSRSYFIAARNLFSSLGTVSSSSNINDTFYNDVQNDLKSPLIFEFFTNIIYYMKHFRDYFDLSDKIFWTENKRKYNWDLLNGTNLDITFPNFIRVFESNNIGNTDYVKELDQFTLLASNNLGLMQNMTITIDSVIANELNSGYIRFNTFQLLSSISMLFK